MSSRRKPRKPASSDAEMAGEYAAAPASRNAARTAAESADHAADEAGRLQSLLNGLTARLDNISRSLEKAQLSDYVNLMNSPWQLIWRNMLSGVTRGIGIALGFTFFAATIVWILQMLGKLNLPIIGDYIAEIVRIVQYQLQIRP